MNKLTKKELTYQALNTGKLEGAQGRFESLSDFLDHVVVGIRTMVTVMLQTYAEDEFLRYIGAKPYERTPLRQDHRNGYRKRILETRFGLIEGLHLARGRKSGTFWSTILARYRRQDERIEEIVSEMFLRGISTRKVGKISRLLWGGEIAPRR